MSTGSDKESQRVPEAEDWTELKMTTNDDGHHRSNKN